MGQLGCLVGIELWVVILLFAESSPIRCLLCAYVFSSISNRSLLLLRFQILDFMESTMNMKERIKSRIDTKIIIFRLYLLIWLSTGALNPDNFHLSYLLWRRLLHY